MTAMARLYAGRAAAIIADSEYSKRSIVARLGVRAAKVSVIPVALGPEFAPAPPGEPLLARYAVTRPYVLYVGNFKPHKNLARLIRAFALLPGRSAVVTRWSWPAAPPTAAPGWGRSPRRSAWARA